MSLDSRSSHLSRLALVVAALWLLPVPVFAQSAAEYKAWLKWCAEQDGTANGDANNPVCMPGSSSSSPGYNANEQAMLGLAGSIGSALGAAIRQGIEESARQAEIDRMQRAWETDQARIRAIEEQGRIAEEQRRKNEALMASLKGSLGQTELAIKRVDTQELTLKSSSELFDQPANPSGTLTLKSSSELFGQPGNPSGTTQQEIPVAAGTPDIAAPDTVTGGRAVNGDQVPAVRKAWDDYLAALQRKNEAEARLDQMERDRRLIERLRQEAEKNVKEQQTRVTLVSPDQPAQRQEEDDKLAQAEKLLAEAAQLDEQASRDLADAKQNADRAGKELVEY